MSMEIVDAKEMEELEQEAEIEAAEEEKNETEEKVNIFKRGWRKVKALVNKGRKNPVVTGVVGLIAGAGAGVAGKMVYDHFSSSDEDTDDLPVLQDYQEEDQNDYDETNEEGVA